MQVPVLIVMKSQEPLQESASLNLQGKNAAIPSYARAPKGVVLDRTFPAVPLGTAHPAEMATFDALKPEKSPRFAVRGYVEVDDIKNAPTESEGEQIFADPTIAPFITCGGTPQLGAAADVAQRLHVSTLAQNGLTGDGVAIAIMDTGINLGHLSTKLGWTPKIDIGNLGAFPGRPSCRASILSIMERCAPTTR
jgi:hypothetical protein